MNRQYSLPSLHRQKSSISLSSRQKTNIMSRIGHQERKWFQKRGKTQSIIFTAQMLSKLRKYFNDLDSDSSGSIGLQELQQPLIIFQFCQSREQVRHLIDTMDLDGSGQVQFSQFLQIFRKFKLKKYTSPKQQQKYQTFMQIFSQKTQNSISRDRNYRLALSQLRRKKLITQLTSNYEVIKPKQRRYQKRKQKLNFIKKVQNQFMQIPQLNYKITQNKKRDYYRIKLGKH